MNPTGFIAKEELERLDARVQLDLDRYVNAPATRHIDLARTELAMWMAAQQIVQDGVFGKDEQDAISEKFGSITLEKLRLFLSNLSASEVRDTVEEKVNSSREKLKETIPTTFSVEVKEIEDSISNSFPG